VKDLQPSYVKIDWAYQMAEGNPELVGQKLARRSGDSTGPSAAVASVQSGGVER